MELTLAELANQPEIVLSVNGTIEQPVGYRQEGVRLTVAYPYGIVATGVRTVTGDAVEWQWSLSNEGIEPTPPISAFRPLSLHLPCQGRFAPILHGCRGGLDDACYPPFTFSLWEKSILTEGLPGPWVARSARGRSSNQDLPFFVLENALGTGGWFLGLGWSGDWDLRMERHVEVVSIHAGMTHLNLTLMPGETFRQPSVLMGVYQGAASDGFRALRNHLRDQVQPRHQGRPVPLMTCFNNYYGDRGNFNAGDFLREIPAAEEVGIDYLVIDGGWTGGGDDARWESVPEHIGNWGRPDPKKFPHGFEPVRKLAEQHGRKMGIWFDVEHAHAKSMALREHPELFFTGLLDNNGCHLLRLDLDAGREWAFQSIANTLKQLGGQYLKFDMNADPAPIWAHNDLPDRRGVTEIRYIENVYRLWDQLLESFPEMLTENCASGGRRIDLEMIRRSHTNWLSDHSQSESIVRYHIYGAAHFLPANQINTGFAHKFLEPNRPVDWNGALPASAYLSLFGGNFILNDRAHQFGQAGRDSLRDYLQHFKHTREVFAGDITFIGEQAQTHAGVTGLVGVDPASGRRAAVIFGAGAQEAAARLPDGFASLAAAGPQAGDMGNEQFTPAYLFYDV
ncbi:MAG: alpha-galactosidase [Anaerolineae bacterium]|nr:alpha-galactosidase [Anaerolineae bacterium]